MINTPGAPGPQVAREAASLGPTGHTLHEAILPRRRDVAALPNPCKQTQGGSQNEKTQIPTEK